MIIVRLKGGLGNQMFQYALGRVLSLKFDTRLKLDTYFLNLNIKGVTKRNYDLDVFDIKAEVSNNIFTSFFLSLFKYKREKGFHFDEDVMNVGGDVYLDGYWQSPKYFKGFEDAIKRDFKLKNIPAKNIQDLEGEISSTDSVCIHVRRGDYVGNKVHETISLDYYKSGLEIISQKTNVKKIYVFSDDIKWCRENLSFPKPTVFVDESFAGEKGEGHMYLMSKCKNFIIANSSFSWWAAWLCDYNDKIIVCPKKWFTDESIDTSDLIPKEWIKI